MEPGTAHPPSRLFGANGLRTGPDGRIYVAQVAGSQISTLNVDTGELETVSAQGADIVAPDDVDFDAQGNLYATEYYDGRVSVRGTDGRTRCCATTCRARTASPSTGAGCSSMSAESVGACCCPFGGYKKSGNGREWGEFGFGDYLEIKGILGCQPVPQ